MRALTELGLSDVQSGRLVISVSLPSTIYKTPGNACGQSAAKCGNYSAAVAVRAAYTYGKVATTVNPLFFHYSTKNHSCQP